MEGLGVSDFWRGKRVLLTGHTGFKGGWLAAWLNALGAQVFGFALEPETKPSLFAQLDVGAFTNHVVGDVRDRTALATRVHGVQPDVVFHLAAQSLVRRSYREPLLTWDINVMGVANLLDALRSMDATCACVVVTTDKVYQNNEWVFPYRETDPLGGHDPYSASKAAVELAVASFRSAFLSGGSAVRIASARAGNVIGGGDWSEDRIVPDLVRALSAGTAIPIRNPDAVRPWQHVIEPLSGYLRLAEALHRSDDPVLQSAFNFGPRPDDVRSVRDLIETALAVWPGDWRDASDPSAPHEARLLNLTVDKARSVLGWQPRWGFEATVSRTIDWYRAVAAGESASAVTLAQIEAYGGA